MKKRIQTFEKSRKNPKKSTKLFKVEKNYLFENKNSRFFWIFFHFPLELYRSQPRHVAGLAPIEFQGEKIERSRKLFLKKIKKNTIKSRTSKKPRKKLIFFSEKKLFFLLFFWIIFDFRPYSLYLYISID